MSIHKLICMQCNKIFKYNICNNRAKNKKFCPSCVKERKEISKIKFALIKNKIKELKKKILCRICYKSLTRYNATICSYECYRELKKYNKNGGLRITKEEHKSCQLGVWDNHNEYI